MQTTSSRYPEEGTGPLGESLCVAVPLAREPPQAIPRRSPAASVARLAVHACMRDDALPVPWGRSLGLPLRVAAAHTEPSRPSYAFRGCWICGPVFRGGAWVGLLDPVPGGGDRLMGQGPLRVLLLLSSTLGNDPRRGSV